MNRDLWKNRTFTNENPINYPCPKCNVGFLTPKKQIVTEITPVGTEMEFYGYPNGIEHIFCGTLICKNKDCKELISISGQCLRDIQFQGLSKDVKPLIECGSIASRGTTQWGQKHLIIEFKFS